MEQPPLIIENAAEDILVLPPNNEDPAKQLNLDEDEGMIYMPEDNIVIEEESILGSEANTNAVDDETIGEDEVAIADIDDVGRRTRANETKENKGWSRSGEITNGFCWKRVWLKKRV